MFSVIIPLYNKEASIKNTIHSVLNQKFKKFELIIVNDGSTDSSFEVVKKINDDRIRLIDQTNQGVSSARNRGIEEAQFNWVAFLDADDLWLDNHLEVVADMIEKYPYENFFSTSFKYSDNREVFRYTRMSGTFKVHNYFKEARKETLVWTGTAVINKKCFNTVGLYNTNLKVGEDTDLWIRLARKYDLIKSSTVTAVYRIEAENRTALSKKLETTYIYYIPFEKIEDNDEKAYFKEMITNRLYQYARAGDLNNFLKLKNRYPTVNYIVFIHYSLQHIFRRGIQVTLRATKRQFTQENL